MSMHRWFTGFFLLLLMVAAILLNGWMFAARNFQEHFAKLSTDHSGVVSLDEIRAISTEMQLVRAKAAPLEKQLAQVRIKIDDGARTIDQLSRKVDTWTADLAAKTSAVEKKLQMETAADATVGGLDARIERLEKNAAAPSQGEIAPLRKQLTDIVSWNGEIVAATEGRTALEAQARALQESLSADRQRLLMSQQQFGDNFDQVLREIEALRRGSPSGVAATLAGNHPITLSIWLVVVMGAMGSLLYLFPAYIANRQGAEVTFVSIVVRTVFGMVVALAFLIVANVGANIFTGASADKAVTFDTLGSFTIAGLGIIAGVMADDIAKWIHERGAFLFQGAGSSLSSSARAAITPTKADLPSGGLVNPHGGPGDPS